MLGLASVLESWLRAGAAKKKTKVAQETDFNCLINEQNITLRLTYSFVS